jgi:integrase
MAATSPSRNPFADPIIPSLADLIARIEAAKELPLRTRQNWVWALRAIARAAGDEPAAVPAHLEFLRIVLERAAPASLGMTRAAWNNARSLAGKALVWAGFMQMPNHYQAKFSPAWQELWEKLPPSTAISFQLSRLFHYASAQGSQPDEINDEAIDNFYLALMKESIVRNPREIHRGAIESWNNATERIPGWPQQRLSFRSRRQFFSLSWNEFPPSLEVDVEVYLRRAAGLDLSDHHFTSPQRPRTLQTRRAQLRLFASAIVKSGVPADSLVDLKTLLTPEIAARGLEFLFDRNNRSSSVQISNIALFLGTLARRLDLSEETVMRLRKFAQKLKVTQNGLTARNREALRAFDDEAAVSALFNLPRHILREVLKSGRRGYSEAKFVQTAMAVELLLNAPVRIQNLASIDLEKHLLEVGTRRSRAVHLRFPAVEVKNANYLEFPLIPEAVELLDCYLSDWRPLLLTGVSSFLFPGKKPNLPKGNGALSSQIRKLVYAHTRLDMPAHRFRHAVAKIFLDRNPGQYEVVRQLLGHKDITTTISFYAGAESASAARHYAQTILGIRGRDLESEARRDDD